MLVTYEPFYFDMIRSVSFAVVYFTQSSGEHVRTGIQIAVQASVLAEYSTAPQKHQRTRSHGALGTARAKT